MCYGSTGLLRYGRRVWPQAASNNGSAKHQHTKHDRRDQHDYHDQHDEHDPHDQHNQHDQHDRPEPTTSTQYQHQPFLPGDAQSHLILELPPSLLDRAGRYGGLCRAAASAATAAATAAGAGAAAGAGTAAG
eukprot:186136-Chlamydomonas_euryale.AAC.5